MLKNLKNKVKSIKLKSKLYMMKDFSRRRATCISANNTRENWRNLSLNIARTIIARGDMPVDTARVMFNGCRKSMSSEEKSKEEDSFSLKWNLLLKKPSKLILKSRKLIQILKKIIRTKMRKSFLIIRKIWFTIYKLNYKRLKFKKKPMQLQKKIIKMK